MKLTDAATVSRETGSGWQQGNQQSSRECSVLMQLRDICENTENNVLIEGDGTRVYQPRPVVLEGVLSSSIWCREDDDAAYLAKALELTVDFAVGRALATEPVAGAGMDGIWIGHEDARTFAYAGDPLNEGTAFAFGQAVGRARIAWYRAVVAEKGAAPVLHVSSLLVPILVRAGVAHLVGDDGDLRTVWGEQIVVSAGYDFEDSTVVAFWTGEIKILVGPVESTDPIVNTRINSATVESTIVAVVDVPPCSILNITFPSGEEGSG